MAATAAESEWGALMAAAQAGHGSAYRRLLGEVAAWPERFFRRRLSPAMVDDAVQDTLMAIHEKRQPMTPRGRSSRG